MYEFRMPSLGADMKAATLIDWKIKPGDKVNRGDIIAELETEKGDIDVEVFEDGIVDQILVEPGNKLPVGTILAIIKQDGEEVEAPEKELITAGTKEAKPKAPEPKISRPGYQEPEIKEKHRVRASPLAKKVAADLGIDLAQVKGSGPGGAIEKADVERTAAELKKEEKPPEMVSPKEKEVGAERPAGMRQAIAAAMSRSNREIPHYYLETTIDMTQPLKWLEMENKKRDIKKRLLPAVILMKAVAKALTDVPELNGYWQNDQLEIQDGIHIGFAISLRQGGLIAPAIHHVDLKRMDELMPDMLDLTMRARSGKLRSSELTDSTITITNLGDRGVETVYGVIYPPQVALVGFGKVTERPWAENGMLDVRPVLTATLSADHRATDGHKGALFLEALNRHLQDIENYD
ncbi:MAG TPA: dihydrolipoamide acetyltransferase family protein [Balneolales bacterium]|nr:dihydrolipoamide acetyltransferase family protein [Balneolales bacterium]